MSGVLIERGSGPRIGLALGGGGARGLAHILVLEAFDELGIKPAIVSGTSIGAIIGAAYASGLSGRDIRWHCEELFNSRAGLMKKLVEKWPGSITDLWNPLSPALFNIETIVDIIFPDKVARDFAGLVIPFVAVATDFHDQSQVVLAEGPLRPAVAASASLPVLLKPVVIDGKVLIDGGFVNPLPYDVLSGRADLVVAVDVNGEPRGDGTSIPSSMEALLGMSQIVMRTILHEKLARKHPDILLSPPVGRFRVLDFYKLKDVLSHCADLKDEVKRQVGARLEAQ